MMKRRWMKSHDGKTMKHVEKVVKGLPFCTSLTKQGKYKVYNDTSYICASRHCITLGVP